MTGSPFPSALREVQADFRKRPVIIGMLALGLILGISGPFGTFDALPAVPRMAYWITVVVLTFWAGSLVSTITHHMLDSRLGWLACFVSTAAIGLTVSVILSFINLAAFGIWFDSWADALGQLGVVTLISGVVEFSAFALRAGPATDPTAQAPLLNRLPFDKRGKIIALSAEDHYVRVATTGGTELVLMRLSDAIAEVGTTAGLQVHRSHWVALDQIQKVNRTGDRAQALMSDGIARPISRGYMPAARKAGLLPAKRNGGR